MFNNIKVYYMPYSSDSFIKENDAKKIMKEEKQRIKNEITQAIENGVIKITSGNEKLFSIINNRDSQLLNEDESCEIYFPKAKIMAYTELIDGKYVRRTCFKDDERRCFHKSCKHNKCNYCQADTRECLKTINSFLNELDS